MRFNVDSKLQKRGRVCLWAKVQGHSSLPGIGFKREGGGDLAELSPTFDDPDNERLLPSEMAMAQLRAAQVDKLNSYLKFKHRKARKRSVAPTFQFIEEPDNPWRDRYLPCAECERRGEFRNLDPRPNCNGSTLLEVDMTAPFSRDNVMAVSCELVQLIRDDVWVIKDKDGKLHRMDQKGVDASFPVQVCCVCRKTSLDEGRKFLTCATCKGAHYCSNTCFMKHRFRHRASCTRPVLPFRSDWGIRRELRQMRDEIYPLIKIWAIKPAEQHMIAWRKQPQKLLSSRPRPGLPPGKSNALATMNSAPIVPRKLTMSRKRASPRPRTKQASTPSDETLLNLGMTREQFVQQDKAWLEKYEASADERRTRILAVAARAGVPECISKTGGPMRVPVKEARRRVALEPDAIYRIEEAASAAPSEVPSEPLWVESEDGTPEKEARRRVEDVDPGPERVDKKPGVVYESEVQKLAKKHKVKLSKAALERLEAAARLGNSFARTTIVKPPIDQDSKDRLLL